MNERSKRSGNKPVKGGGGTGHSSFFFNTVPTANSLVHHITCQLRPWYYRYSTVWLVYCDAIIMLCDNRPVTSARKKDKNLFRRSALHLALPETRLRPTGVLTDTTDRAELDRQVTVATHNTLTPRYPGWPDFRKYIRDNGVSGTTERWGVRIT